MQSAHAADWVGDTSQDWNDATNWSGDVAPTGNFVINTADPGLFPVIGTAPAWGPVDLFVGTGGGNSGRLDQTTGTLQTAVTGTNGNWAFVGTGGGTGTYNLTGDGSFAAGKLWIGGQVYGDNGTGTVTVDTTGSLTVESTDDFSGWGQYQTSLSIGWGGSGNGTLNLVNGTVNSLNKAIYVASWGSTGALNQTGGTINTAGLEVGKWFSQGGSVSVGNGTLNSGYISLAGSGNSGDVMGNNTLIANSGGIVNSEGDLIVGVGGAVGSSGTVTINDGGIVNVGTATERWMIIGQFDSANATLNVNSGGALNLNAGTDIRMSANGNVGTRVINVNGGSLLGTGGSVIEMGRVDNSGSDTLNISNGGVVHAQAIYTNAATTSAVINFDNGTLRAVGDDANLINLAGTGTREVNILAGGATFDSNGYHVTIHNAMLDGSGGGGLTKNGEGTLSLLGNNTYTGATTVSAGTLFVAGSLGNGAVTVADGATLGGPGTINGATSIQAGGTLSAGNSPGVMTFGSTLTLEGTSLFEIGGMVRGTEYDGIDVGGLLTYGGALDIVAYDLGGGLYDLTQAAAFDLFGIGSGTAGDFASVTVGGNALTLDSGVWSGVDSSNSNVLYTFNQKTGDLTVAVVPEPGAALLGGLGMLALLRRRRR